MLPLQGARVRSLVGELRSCKPRGMEKKRDRERERGNRLSLKKKKKTLVTISLQKIHLLPDFWFPNILVTIGLVSY